MGSTQEYNEAGPSGTRHSSDHGSDTAVSGFSVFEIMKRDSDLLQDHIGLGPTGTHHSSDTLPARIRNFLCSLYEPLHTRFRAAFRVRTAHPTTTILPMASVGPTTPQVPSTLPPVAAVDTM